MFGFCMARLVTLSLRISWAVHPRNVRLAIAASIFVNARHPNHLYHQPGIGAAHLTSDASGPGLEQGCQGRIQSALHRHCRSTRHGHHIGGGLHVHAQPSHQNRPAETFSWRQSHTYWCLPASLSFTSPPLSFLPRAQDPENFGEGSLKSKLIILTTSASLCVLIAGFQSWLTVDATTASDQPTMVRFQGLLLHLQFLARDPLAWTLDFYPDRQKISSYQTGRSRLETIAGSLKMDRTSWCTGCRQKMLRRYSQVESYSICAADKEFISISGSGPHVWAWDLAGARRFSKANSFRTIDVPLQGKFL